MSDKRIRMVVSAIANRYFKKRYHCKQCNKLTNLDYTNGLCLNCWKELGNNEIIIKSNVNRWKSVNWSELISECRQFYSATSDEKLREMKYKSYSEDRYKKWGIVQIWDMIYYDENEKIFFSVCVDGNFYHGYDVEYFVETKENVLKMLAQDIYRNRQISHTDELPISAISLVIADRLEVNSDIKEYKPPIEVGKGLYYI